MTRWSREAKLVCLIASASVAACAKDQPEPRATTDRPSSPVATAPAVPSIAKIVARWDSVDGSAIYVPSEGGGVQVILPPVVDDSVPAPGAIALPAGAAPGSVDLFAPSGLIGTVALGEYSAAAQPEVGDGCDAWPVVPLREGAALAPHSWRIALQAGVAEPLPADSLASLSRSDSAQLVVAINKAAALLPLDSAGVLRRVPFSVTKAYQMRFPGDVEAVVAVVERRLNMEASPRVERTVLVLERPPQVKVFSAVWRETQYTTEDDLVAVDLLAVVRMHGAPRPTVFLGLDFGDGSRIEMLQRTNGGIWSLRWSSAYTGC
ncbi:MAG: hypothetical protein U5K74_10890 [Gemmatimonadaceae bacterium]|nr:hypothetical protein [Gemmatimonadaceae bacterium]